MGYEGRKPTRRVCASAKCAENTTWHNAYKMGWRCVTCGTETAVSEKKKGAPA